MWISIESCPVDKQVIFLFSDGHIENGELSHYDGQICHWLHSGEVYSSEPIAFMFIPEGTQS